MDIKRAKQEIKDSIEACLAKDEFGAYRIPPIRQRPILLMGPPGIGKTQIMEQIARECHVGLVAYTITHHTRQSAVGLPFIKEKQYGEKTYSVTEYTMSEIIASVYEKIEQTGIKEGILFIDEINCVSETLAPAMLQFLQGKTFGNQKVPEGWMIVAVGNPPEYNKSVRDFDVVTLDRLKKIDLEENFDVWKEYAYRQGIHPAVISYLELRKHHFYRVETTVDGKKFATARGWEDLSQFIQVYETLGKNIDREVVCQYIQHEKIAKDFANYLELYYKYKADYGVEDILKGRWNKAVLQKIRAAAFDEHLSIVSLLNGKLGELFTECYLCDAYVSKLYQYLIHYKENKTAERIEDIWHLAERELADLEKKELLDRQDELIMKRVIAALERFTICSKGEVSDAEAAFDAVKGLFQKEVDKRETSVEHTSEMLTHVFDFMEEAFGDSQEMVALITELNANYYSIWFIKENGCDQYYRHNKGLLFQERQQSILREMDDIEGILNTSLK
ncbi:MAG: AAA family ATPase [Ruminococcus sp.]|jgi:DNA polymerase III delta prime subunit|nr:AAA family ATPase [Ruminococcus sp.]